MADGTPVQVGLDLAVAHEPATALRLARDRGQVTLSAAYRLLSDRAMPTGDQQLSFLMAAPVFAPDLPVETVAQRRDALRGS